MSPAHSPLLQKARNQLTTPIGLGVMMPALISFAVFGSAWLGAPRWVDYSVKQSTFRQELETILAQDSEMEASAALPTAVLSVSTQTLENVPTQTPENSEADTEEPINLNPDTDIVAATHPEYRLLIDRYNAIDQRVEEYGSMFNFFYRLHFALIWAATISSIMLAVSAGGSFLGAYSNNGEANQDSQQINKFLRTLFLSTTAMSLLFFNLPGILKLGDNHRASWELVKELTSLSNKIDTFIITGGITVMNAESQAEFKRMDTNRFIHHIDQELDRLHQLPVGFDQSAINRISSLDSNSIFPQRPSE